LIITFVTHALLPSSTAWKDLVPPVFALNVRPDILLTMANALNVQNVQLINSSQEAAVELEPPTIILVKVAQLV